MDDLWRIFRMSTWDHDIDSVEHKDGHLIMVEGEKREPLRRRYMHPFPTKFQGDEPIVRTMLSYKTCDLALVMLRPILDEKLKGLQFC